MGWIDDLKDWVGDHVVPWGEKSAAWRAEDSQTRVLAVRETARHRPILRAFVRAQSRVFLAGLAAKAFGFFAVLLGGVCAWGLLGSGPDLSATWPLTAAGIALVSRVVAARQRQLVHSIARQPGGALPELFEAFWEAAREYRRLRALVERAGRSRDELEPAVQLMTTLAETIEVYDRAVRDDALDTLALKHRALIQRVHEHVDDLGRSRQARRELMELGL